nr:hypothetical protein [Tanacetum cinerariifolium]
FWNTTVVKRTGDVTRLQALVDKKRIVISEEVVREILQLNDAEGVICLPNEEIFAGLARMGYEKPSTKLTFYKAFFSTQWKFFIHTILHSLSAKRTSWNEFSSAMTVGKGFSGVETPLFETMLVVRDVAEDAKAHVPAQGDEFQEHDAEEVATDVGTSQRVESSDDVENVFNQGRMIVDMDQDEGIELVVDQEKDAEVVAASTPIPAAKPKTLTITDAPAVSTRRRKGVKDQIEMDAEYARKLQKEINKEHEESYKNIDWNADLDHNTKGYKMDFFKGKTYDEILPIFQAKFDANMKFLFKSREEMEAEDEEIIKSINETPAQKAVKRRKLSEEAKEADDLRKRLEIVQDEDDDVFVEATPPAQKVPVVDYQIVVIDNKP